MTGSNRFNRGFTFGSSRYAIGIVAFTAAVVVVSIVAWRRYHHVPKLPNGTGATPSVAVKPGPFVPDPPGILIHHSDTPASAHGKPFDAAALDRIAAQRGFSTTFEGKVYHISYHYVILPDGTVQKGRPDHCQGAHCPRYNNWIGIVLIGDFQSASKRWWPTQPTDLQKQSLVKLCESLMSEYHIPPENVRRHRDEHETWCPGVRFPYAEIVRELRGYSQEHAETRTRQQLPALIASAGNSKVIVH